MSALPKKGMEAVAQNNIWKLRIFQKETKTSVFLKDLFIYFIERQKEGESVGTKWGRGRESSSTEPAAGLISQP